jgi:CRP-like cAMP-binding protein
MGEDDPLDSEPRVLQLARDRRAPAGTAGVNERRHVSDDEVRRGKSSRRETKQVRADPLHLRFRSFVSARLSQNTGKYSLERILPGTSVAQVSRLPRCDAVRREQPGARGAVELAFDYSQDDLAAMIGGARQSMNRVLRGLEREGLVRLEGDRLFISDVESLEPRAGL